MLLELRVENYAVIDRAVAGFAAGLNLLTGETGAGKSILIDALALLLGGKASSEVVRHGAEKAVVGCVFEMTPGALAILEANGIEADSDDILLRREIAGNGKGRVFVNNQPATVGVLRQLAPELALIHAQGETMGAFDATQQRLLLDRFAGVPLDAVDAAFGTWRATMERLEGLQSAEQDRLRMADLWRFQASEIDGAGLGAADEDAVLEAEKRLLGNAEKLYAAAMSAQELLYEGENSAETTLGAALKSIEELARYDARFQGPAQQLAAAKATVEDVAAEARSFAEGMSASPGRLEEIEDRLAALDRLKRKYGQTLAEVIAFGQEAARQLAEVENRDALLVELKAREVADAGAYRVAAGALTSARQEAAKRLATLAEAQINDLAMRVRFAVRVVPAEVAPTLSDKAGKDGAPGESGLGLVAPTLSDSAGKDGAPGGLGLGREGQALSDGAGRDGVSGGGGPSRAQWTAHGWDAVECLIATNSGEPLKPLDEIASGGEMSRVMLALKVTVEEGVAGGRKKKSPLPRTLVFDEIDIGIGGRAAEAVGRKLKTLSKTQQVLCITHLPQIAAFGNQHFLIEKTEKQGRTQTQVRRMEAEERTREIARMLSGEKLTETSLRHAEALLASSR